MISTKHIGKPVGRVDGKAKVTGSAKYAAEFQTDDLLYGYVVTSEIARGKIVSLDSSAAMQIPGVIEVFSHLNVSGLARFDRSYKDMDSVGGSPFRPLHSKDILFSMQPVALVVAESFELARYAATLVRIIYNQETPVTNLTENLSDSYKAPKGKTGFKPPVSRGNAAKAFKNAPVTNRQEYIHGPEHHNPMEMFATVAVYEGDDKLRIYDKTQGVSNVQTYVTKVFGLSQKNVRVISPYVGGGFGSGLRPQYQLFMAVLAALELKRSVKVSLTRNQMFSFGHRPKSVQHLALSSTTDGELQSVEHAAFAETSRFEDYTEVVVNWSGLNYQCENVKTEYELVKLDTYTPLDMRAPGAVTGAHPLEVAMDELAFKLNIDPLEFRKQNYALKDQNEKRDFSSKELMACYLEGAEKFGWAKRDPEPRSMKEGNQLVGWGMATGAWDAMQMKAAAKAVLTKEGRLLVCSGTSDIGTGTYTIMTQIAGEYLGLPLDKVEFTLGDTDMPVAPLQGGSWTAVSVGSAVKTACEEIAAKLFKATKKIHSELKKYSFEDVIFENEHMIVAKDPSLSFNIAEIMAVTEEIEAEGVAGPSMIDMMKYSFNSHAAVFVEVKVDEDLGVIQVSRVVSAIAGGKILNPKTARSQIIGGVVWGLSMALREDTKMDHNLGRFMNHSLGEYHIPVNADIFDIDVIFVEEEDTIINPLGAKGLGEIGIVGVAGAVANAVFHATGKRVRNLPIHFDELL